MSLRSRLLLGLLGLVAVGLVASDLLTYRALQSFLLARLDEQVTDAADPVAQRLLPSRDHRDVPRAVIPGGSYGAVVGADGTVVASAYWGYEGELEQRPQPVVKVADLARTQPFTTDAVGSGSRSDGFRVLTARLSTGNTLVVAIPMRDLVATLGRLVKIELAVTAAVLAALAGLAFVVVRAGLRPLVDIEHTAEAIAAGDLSRRVDRAESRTEVGRLGLSLNAMLGQIQASFEARQASEDRLRRFVADASHELRTPLTSIRGYAELFRRGAAERPDDLAVAMRRIEQESARMGLLVDDLLLLARLDQGRPLEHHPVDLDRVAADAVHDALAVEPDRPIELLAAERVTVQGDELRLRQVAANLLANVRQHTPPGTPVTVSVRRAGDAAVLEVADQGPGLAPDQAARVFERFYRADPSRARSAGGTGLGLSIVAAVAEAHGGAARVTSSPGAGARFWVELPLAGVAPLAPASQPALS